MPDIALRQIFTDAGITSARALTGVTGIDDPSVRQQAQRASIGSFYKRVGRFRSDLGLPRSEVRFDDDAGTQLFGGGRIEFLGMTPKGWVETCVRVRFVGFHCDRESEHDQLSDTDEPYFVIGVAGSNRSNTVRFGPYEDIESGSDRFEAAMISDPFPAMSMLIVPPVVIGVLAMEHDEGTPQEAEDKVRAVFEKIEEKFDQAVNTVSGTGGGSHVMPDWARDILIGWVPEGVAAVFGLGDDLIGSVPKVMFDFDPGLGNKWTTPPRIGMHGDNAYNTVIVVDGGAEGKYELRFNVEIVDLSIGVEG